MEKYLAANDFFAAGYYTIADIALYGCTHLAHECDFALDELPAISAWLNRVVDQPGHVPMDWHPGEVEAAREEGAAAIAIILRSARRARLEGGGILGAWGHPLRRHASHGSSG
jgi:hypothetical protein